MFTNMKAARVITSMMKASMEVLLFQWSQLEMIQNGCLWLRHGRGEFKVSRCLINSFRKYLCFLIYKTNYFTKMITRKKISGMLQTLKWLGEFGKIIELCKF